MNEAERKMADGIGLTAWRYRPEGPFSKGRCGNSDKQSRAGHPYLVGGCARDSGCPKPLFLDLMI